MKYLLMLLHCRHKMVDFETIKLSKRLEFSDDNCCILLHVSYLVPIALRHVHTLRIMAIFSHPGRLRLVTHSPTLTAYRRAVPLLRHSDALLSRPEAAAL